MNLQTVTAVGVCIPVHNEQACLPRALEALCHAFQMLDDCEVDTRLVIVLDDCSDRSEAIARAFARQPGHVPTTVLISSAHNVGVARQAGCLSLVQNWRNSDPSGVWLATTDADSEVPPDWLTHQLDCKKRNVDLWAGRVEVSDWSGRSSQTPWMWTKAYRSEPAPIHGANMGLNAALFLEVGGFPPLSTGEDDAIRDAVLRSGSTVLYDWRAPVKTSARSGARAPLGFAHYLDTLETSGLLSAPMAQRP